MTTIQLTLGIIEIVLAIVIVVLVLLQNKGSDMGGLMGGGGDMGGGRTRRGVEATLHRITIIFGVLFFAMTLITFFAWGI